MSYVNLVLCIVLSVGLRSTHAGQSAHDQPPTAITVRLASGREFRGAVDPRTDETQLWLRSTYGEAVVLRPVRWEQIRSAAVRDKVLDATAFRELAQQVKSATPRSPWPASSSSPRVAATPLTLTSPTPPGLFVPLVRSLNASAEWSNWDADAIPDGLTLAVQPLRCDGEIVPVEGIVEATLFGYDHRSGLPLEHWSQLATWSQPITLACYRPDGGTVRLPMDRQLIHLPRSGSPRWLLRVRLAAPGHGTFEAEIPLWAMRPVP